MKKALVAATVVAVVAIVGAAGAAVAKHRDGEWRRDGREGFGNCKMMQGHERGMRHGDRRDGRPDERRDWKRDDRGHRNFCRSGGDRRMGMERGHRGHGMPGRPDMADRGRRQGFMPMGRDGMGRMMQNVPDDIRAKMNELAKLKIDMRDALTRNPVDRAKAVEIHGKMSTLMQDIGTWRFNRRLDNIEQRRKEMELNKKVPTGAPSSAISGDNTNSR